MDYDEFADRFLAALYLETEVHDQTIVRAETIIDKYGLQPKPHWISRMADEWEYSYFKKIYKVLGGYEGWSFSLAPDGYRKVETEHGNTNEIVQFLEIDEGNGIDSLLSNLAPASDRTISFTDNQDLSAKLVDGVASIKEKINSSNELDPAEKSDVAVSLGASVSLIQKSKTLLVGAFRYLVLERIKKAFEKSIEDAIRVAILGILATLVALIMAVV